MQKHAQSALRIPVRWTDKLDRDANSKNSAHRRELQGSQLDHPFYEPTPSVSLHAFRHSAVKVTITLPLYHSGLNVAVCDESMGSKRMSLMEKQHRT